MYTCILNVYLFEGVCVHTAVISALPARESAAREASRDRGTDGIHFQSARRSSGFYARPLLRLEFGAFFRRKTSLARGIRYTISFFEHLSSESVKNDHKKKKCEKLSVFVVFRAPSSKTHVIVERCCKNRVHAIFIEFRIVFEPVKMCCFSSVGRIFFLGAAKFRSGVRARMLFFKGCVRGR